MRKFSKSEKSFAKTSATEKGKTCGSNGHFLMSFFVPILNTHQFNRFSSCIKQMQFFISILVLDLLETNKHQVVNN